jgi:peptide/nickel transport system permease protein
VERLAYLSYRLRKSPLTLVGMGIITTLVFTAIFAPFLTTHDPYQISPPDRLKPPSAQHWFGTDTAGRDIFSRVIHGARISIQIGVTVVFLATFIGSIIGLFSGYLGGKFDEVVMRVTDVFF